MWGSKAGKGKNCQPVRSAGSAEGYKPGADGIVLYHFGIFGARFFGLGFDSAIAPASSP
jgi:hypothetical protein